MKYAELLALRDHTIRDFLIAKLPISDEQRQSLAQFFDKAIEAADQDLKLQVQDLFGKDAERVLKRKHEAEQLNL